MEESWISCAQIFRKRLMKEHFEFRKLMEEHKFADSRLGDLQEKPSLSAKETLEEVELKKIKLRGKETDYHMVQEASKRAEQYAAALVGEAPEIGRAPLVGCRTADDADPRR